MGYTTDFSGAVAVDPPLNEAEIKYLRDFSGSRRMDRRKGPYFAEPGNDFGQDIQDDVLDGNCPPKGQPGLWCQWVPNKHGTAIVWDGNEKFYDSAEWMKYIIEHFLKPGALAAAQLPFLQANHIVNGAIDAQGEDTDDRWRLVVENNKVFIEQGNYHFERKIPA